MKRTGTVLGVAAVALWSAGVFAQGRNFAGSWTIDMERMAASGAAGGVMAAAAGGSGGGGMARSGGGGGGVAVGGGGGAVGGGATAGAVMRSGGGGGARSGAMGGPTTITLDASTFTVGATAYHLDGSVTTIETPRGTSTAKAAWKGDKLVVETTSQGPNGPMVSTATWYLDGAELIRETSTPAPDGGEARVSKVYYKRS